MFRHRWVGTRKRKGGDGDMNLTLWQEIGISLVIIGGVPLALIVVILMVMVAVKFWSGKDC